MSARVLQRLQAQFPDAVTAAGMNRGDAVATIRADQNLEVLAFLRADAECDFNLPIDLCGVDWLGLERTPRYEVVYNLYSIPKRHRIRLKAPLTDDDKPSIRSCMEIYRGFDWYEREAYDMFGIRFVGHPSLKRMFMYDEFIGHPLRKDFPKERRFPLSRREGKD